MHLVFAESLCAAPDVCAADELELGAGVGVWVRSCCASKRENESTAISLRNRIIRCLGPHLLGLD